MVLFIFCILMIGCEKKESTSEKHTLVIGSGQAPNTMNPIEDYNGWYSVRYGICQTLTKMNDDYSISGWLVEDNVVSSDDHKVWTFTIKDNIRFSNGKKVDAEAVKNSLWNVFEHGERGVEYFTPVSIEAKGQNLVITTQVSEPILQNKLADPLFCIIDTSVENDNTYDLGAIGTGPFVLDSFDYTTKACSVVKNENYWNGEVKMDRIEFVYSEEQSVLSFGLQAGEFDCVYNVSMNDIGIFEGNEDYKMEKAPSGRTTIGFMNQNRWLGDLTLRRAILQMLDKDTFCENLLKNQYIPGKTLLTSAANYGYHTLNDPNEYQPENAKKILEQAGYQDLNGDGYLESPSGEEINLHFVYYSGRPEQQILVEATQAVLATIGIRITPELYDTQRVMELQKSGDYDLLCMSINMMNCGDPENQMNTFFKSGGTYNATGYENEQFNQLLEKIHSTSKEMERNTYIIEAERILLEDAVSINYCYPVMNFVMKRQVNGITSTPADFYWVNETTSVE